MPFTSAYSYGIFCHEVKSNGRFVLGDGELEFLNSLKETWEKRRILIPKGTEVFRAQISHKEIVHRNEDGIIKDIEIVASEDHRLIPSKEFATEGRLNPKGILVYYFSMSKETAMSELRPWINSKITVGTYVTNIDLEAIDLTLDPFFSYPEDDTDEWKEKVVWGDVNYGFSEPFVNTDVSAEYVPTQILAEFFRKNGFKAIVHESSLGKSKNVVFFNNDYLELKSKEVKSVDSIEYKFYNAF